MTTTDTIASPPQPSSYPKAAQTACKRLAPLWPLESFVAVNPFLGLADKSFIDACDLVGRVAPGGMQIPLSYYQEKFEKDEISTRDLDAALAHSQKVLPAEWASAAAQLDTTALVSALADPSQASTSSEILTVADALDRSTGSSWVTHITELISQFCAGYYDSHQSAWRQPWSELSLFNAWHEAASIDAKAEFLGLKSFRKFVAALPQDEGQALAQALQVLEVSEEDAPDFLHRQLMSIRGWAGHVQYLVREKEMAGGEDSALLELLTIRLCYDAALLDSFDSPALRECWNAEQIESPSTTSAVLISHLWQLAHEHAWQQKLVAQLLAADPAPAAERPSAQAVFCIDVRSEVFRRALEAVDPTIQTLGFAGFFGMAIEHIPFGQHQGPAQCPVLLSPSYRIRETLVDGKPAEVEEAWKKQRLNKRLGFSWNSFKTSAISCFSFVETTGLAYGPKLFRDTFSPGAKGGSHVHRFHPSIAQTEGEDTGIPEADRIQLALGALGHMGLRKNFARLVLLCGHGSETRNNPYGSGLDCGACGGHAGDTNARVAVAILNDPIVRTALVEKGITIPEDTHFLAGLHNTTTDQVTLFGGNKLPESHHKDLAELEETLKLAGQKTRQERAPSLGLEATSPKLDEQVFQRALDWAEVRPEWGLAGNAAFIAAPRARTKQAKLGGRVFLHDYNHSADPGEGTLELILVAPMVVASWINLQYYASTVNNEAFGSGNKVTHNVVGTIGVCQGNTGDLQTGLPLQSVHDGENWVHEPLRLHVFIEAPRASLSALLEKHGGVRDLVGNGWVLLFAIEDEGKSHYQHLPNGDWESVKTS